MTESIKMLPSPRYLVKRNLANKTYENQLPDKPAAQKENGARTNSTRTRNHKEPPFAAKVRRRWEDAKSKVSKRLGLYTLLEPLPIGMYIDMVI